MPPTAPYRRLLHFLGWSVGDVAFCDVETGRKLWRVTGTRGQHTISAKGRTQSEAWREACRLAGRVEREG